MGIALAPSLRGGAARRAGYGQAMIDASWAMASRGGGRFDPDFMVGATLPSYPAWLAGTAIGVFAGELIADPERLRTLFGREEERRRADRNGSREEQRPEDPEQVHHADPLVIERE